MLKGYFQLRIVELLIISSDGKADKAISARIFHFSRKKIAMLRFKPALVSKRLTLMNNVFLIETLLRPVLLYGLETLAVRCTDLGSLEAVIHRTKRMSLRLEKRNDVKLNEMIEKVKPTPVAHQLCRRRVQLYASLKKIGVDSLNDLLEGAKIWQNTDLCGLELILTTMRSRQNLTRTTG